MGYFSGLFPELDEPEQDEALKEQKLDAAMRAQQGLPPAKAEEKKAGPQEKVLPPSQGYTPNKLTQDSTKETLTDVGASMEKALKVGAKALDVIDQVTKKGTSMERGVVEDFKYPKGHQNDGQQPELDGQEDQPVDSAGQPKPAEPPNPNHINDVFKNLGVNAWVPMIGTFAAGLGLSQGQLNTPITTIGPAFLRVLAAVDKKNVIPAYMNDEMSVARRLDREQYAKEDAKMSRSEKMEQEEQSRLSYERTASKARIEGKEMQLRQLYDRLKETPIMRTWYGMIAYVLLSILTRSPSFAARTLMGSQHPEVLGNELRRIQQSIEKEDRWGQHLGQQYSQSRRQAIQNQQGREERLDQRKYMERKEANQMQAYAERARARAEQISRKENATAQEKHIASIDKKLTGAYDRAVYERESALRQVRAEKDAFSGDKVKLAKAEKDAAYWNTEAQKLGDQLKAWDARFLPVFEREE